MKAILALNTGDTSMELALLNGLFDQVEAMKGVYKGIEEDSYIITIEHYHYASQLKTVMMIAEKFNQESILLVHDNEGYEAELYFIADGHMIDLGIFESEIDGSLPAGITDYTQSKQTGRYYFVR